MMLCQINARGDNKESLINELKKAIDKIEKGLDNDFEVNEKGSHDFTTKNF